MAVSYKTVYPFTIQPNNCTLGHLSQRNENLCPLKNLYMNVHEALFIVVEKWKQPKYPWYKLCYIPIMEYYSAIKSNEILIHALTWMDLKCIILSEKKPISKGYILYACIYITPLKWQNHKDEEEINGCRGTGTEAGDERDFKGAIQGSSFAVREHFHILTTMVITQLYIRIKRPRATHTHTHTQVHIKTGENLNKICGLINSTVPMDVNFLALILYYGYIRCHHWEAGWRAQGTLVLLFQLLMNL